MRLADCSCKDIKHNYTTINLPNAIMNSWSSHRETTGIAVIKIWSKRKVLVLSTLKDKKMIPHM
jgi:hypothetical protein